MDDLDTEFPKDKGQPCLTSEKPFSFIFSDP